MVAAPLSRYIAGHSHMRGVGCLYRRHVSAGSWNCLGWDVVVFQLIDPHDQNGTAASIEVVCQPGRRRVALADHLVPPVLMICAPDAGP